jgi:CheY-like chemotaxis protein
MDQNYKPILIAEDDEDDYLLTIEALKEAGVDRPVQWVRDGEELMEYLHKLSSADGKNIKPSMIFLDLNMPKKDGREALAEIKTNPAMCDIPVIVLTTSKADSDIAHTYKLGVNSFIQKPLRFFDLVKTIKILSQYWFEVVKLPS